MLAVKSMEIWIQIAAFLFQYSGDYINFSLSHTFDALPVNFRVWVKGTYDNTFETTLDY
jgi:hypothetical protein